MIFFFFYFRLGLSKHMVSDDNSVLILGKSPYKHQNETFGPYLSLIFGIFWGVGEVGEVMVPSPRPLTPKYALNNLWTNKELLIIRDKFW